ncbi:ankyrin repeat domain-containing protein [Wolbachia pipientis]|uniref:ankyrin repeat domain-containing protein n=1 Tax=Wolbachia pipientis TaxID=955 RepID=UPI0020B647A2|nr:ankyrin repeat domain-containing protein [Wolbachia pipientis]
MLLEVVKFFIGEKHANTNSRDINNETPLHKAAWNGNLDVVRYLIEEGATIDSKDKNGKTPYKQLRQMVSKT